MPGQPEGVPRTGNLEAETKVVIYTTGQCWLTILNRGGGIQCARNKYKVD